MVRKFSLIYGIFSMTALFAMLGYMFSSTQTMTQYMCFFLVGIAILVPNGILKKHNFVELNALKDVYANHCDPIEFADQYQRYIRHCFISKGEQVMNTIFIARMKISGGQIEEGQHDLLLLKDSYTKMSSYQQFWYLAGWIEIYTELNQSGRSQALIDELGRIMNSCDYKIGQALDYDYKNILMTFYVNNNLNLDIAKSTLNDLIKKGMSLAGLMQTYYLLGRIAYYEGDKAIAIQYFNNVIQKGNRLAVVNKAKSYMALLNE